MDRKGPGKSVLDRVRKTGYKKTSELSLTELKTIKSRKYRTQTAARAAGSVLGIEPGSVRKFALNTVKLQDSEKAKIPKIESTIKQHMQPVVDGVMPGPGAYRKPGSLRKAVLRKETVKKAFEGFE